MAAQGGSATRAFANKLSKFQPHAEARRKVYQTSSSHSTSSSSSASSFLQFATGKIPLNEVVNPPEFEDFVLQNQPLNENDPDSKMLEFPDDDIEVTTIPRHCRTVEPCIPKDMGSDSDPHLKDCIRCYIRDWAIVNRRYQFRCDEEGKPDSRRKVTRDATFVSKLAREVYEVDEKGKHDEQEKSDAQPRPQTLGVSGMDDMPRGSWASSIFDLQSCQPDVLLPSLLDRTPPEDVDKANKEQRSQNRIHSLVSIYPYQQEEGIEKRVPATIPTEHFGQRIFVRCQSLKLELEVEPFFATMALYDGRLKKKISENFYFDMNSEFCKKLVRANNPVTDISTLSRSAIFSITYPSTEVFLVIKLEKVLQQGDISDCAEPYMKEADKQKDKDKLRASVVANCERLGKYRMPFAWTAIHLIDIISGAPTANVETGGGAAEKDPASAAASSRRTSGEGAIPAQRASKRKDTEGTPNRSSEIRKSFHGSNVLDVMDYEPLPDLSNFRSVTLTVNSFFKQESDRLKDEDLYKFLADLKRPSSLLKRLKCIPGQLKLEILPPVEKQQCVLTSQLSMVRPYPDKQTRPTKEIEEFAPKEVFAPFLTYKNLLYIYPLSVNFSSRTGSARNIAVKVQFMASENPKSQESQVALECIYGKSSCTAVSSEAWGAVTYHNKFPDFYEEIKLKLPAHLTDQHHILFTFYHISCSPGKKPEEKAGPVETPIGYTWIPALKDGRLALGEFNLPVSLEQPPPSYNMLSPEVQLPGMKWVEGHKGVFHVAVRTVSSIHTQDSYIHKFLRMCHQIEGRVMSPTRNAEVNLETALRKSILDLPKAREEPLVRFLHLLLDKLILLLVRPPTISGTVVNISQSAFESLSQIVHRLHQLLENNQDDHGRNHLLASYVTYVFSAPFTVSPSSTPDIYSGEEADSPGQLSNLRKTSLSNSNPQLSGGRSEDSGVGSLSSRATKGQGGSERLQGEFGGKAGISSAPGNRSSVVESRERAINVPGLTRPNSNRKLVHEELVLQWCVASAPVKQLAMAHAWFLFEIMVKSMAQHLDNNDKFFWPRKNRFPERFLDDIQALVLSAINDIVKKNSDVVSVTQLNSSLGFFLYDLLSLLDRGFVLELIKLYCTQMFLHSKEDPSLSHLRLDLLRIVCSHEHYVTLNLPFPTALYPSPPSSPTPSMSSLSSESSCATITPENSMAELSVPFRQQHFLAGLLLSELALALAECDPILQCQAIDCVRDLIACHDQDTRYDDPVCRSRVAALYLPLISIVIEALPQLFGYGNEETSGFTPDVALAIASSSIAGMEEHNWSLQRNKPQQLSPESTKNLLLCFLWVLKNMDDSVLKSCWADMQPARLGLFLDIIHLCVTLFEYKGKKHLIKTTPQTPAAPRSNNAQDMKARLEEALLGNKSAAKDMMQRHSKNLSGTFGLDKSPAAEPKLRWRKDQTQWKQAAEQQDKVRPEMEILSQIEGSLAAEVNMIALDSLELLVQTVSSMDSLRVILSGILRVLHHCLNCHQSERVLQNVFSTQRSIVYKFPELLFEEDTELCADLCSRLLNHCKSSISSIRAQASASLYLLMRQNFEIGNNFARVKMQVTMSLSSLAAQQQDFNEDYLRKSLKTIITYAESDIELRNTTFPEQVRELVFNLHMILSDTVKMKEYSEDPEMLMDLMYRIAKGYQNSPDLRITWLHSMASKHKMLANYTEAAMCYVHAAGLVSEYLSMLEDKRYLPVGCVSFEKISPNVLEESAVSDDVVSPDEEGICTGKSFTENGLVSLLEQAAGLFFSGHMFECVNEVYKLLIPMLESRRSYWKLANIHKKLSDTFDKIVQTEGKRMMGTYFRVGFYGSSFGDLDGEEFIYKEPAITKLPEIAHRLQDFYEKRFGSGSVVVIKDSNVVEREKLDPDKAYIQPTYVEPYFDEYELKDRITYFDKNYNLRRFVYETPFTPSGKAHGELSNQYKRKTILTVANAFPYVKNRISVVHREQIVLSPIEVAIEDMEIRTKDLISAIEQDPPDLKMLQMVLQGSIGTTVNQGPLEIAVVFLSPFFNVAQAEDEEEAPTVTRQHHKLRLCFKEFINRCEDALHKNKHLIPPEQRAYHKEMERNFHKLSEELEPMLHNKFGTLRGSFRKKQGHALLRKISMSFSAGHSMA